MKRRDFYLQLAGAALAGAAVSTARAQGAPVEGQQYKRLNAPLQPQLPAGKKIEVIEFFSYACPHCHAFEPVLENWVQSLAADVYFHPVPVGFVAGRSWVPKVFYALEEIGQRAAMHRKLFSALHVEHLPLISEADAVRFLVSAGVDDLKLSEALKSFSVDNRVGRAAALLAGYKVDGVPLIGVQGRYTAQGAVDGSHQRALPVFDYLIQRVRQGA
jgi:thiol:disulfide interchange protein DsbA